MADNLKPGDVVRLKGGGPAMTVERVEHDKVSSTMTVQCVWFQRLESALVSSAAAASTGEPIWGDHRRQQFPYAALVLESDRAVVLVAGGAKP